MRIFFRCEKSLRIFSHCTLVPLFVGIRKLLRQDFLLLDKLLWFSWIECCLELWIGSINLKLMLNLSDFMLSMAFCLVKNDGNSGINTRKGLILNLINAQINLNLVVNLRINLNPLSNPWINLNPRIYYKLKIQSNS